MANIVICNEICVFVLVLMFICFSARQSTWQERPADRGRNPWTMPKITRNLFVAADSAGAGSATEDLR